MRPTNWNRFKDIVLKSKRRTSGRYHGSIVNQNSTKLHSSIFQCPDWLKLEFKTNHAGEYGAVRIYEGAKVGIKMSSFCRSDIANEKMNRFITTHIETERKHFELFENIVAKKDQTSLIFLWHISGFMLGFLPSLVGPRALYWTVVAVETFVEEHYKSQINRLKLEGDHLPYVRELLESLCSDEIEHKNEAQYALVGNKSLSASFFPRVWMFIVDQGSRYAVLLSKKL
jgi:ubiquinone biosynthesis monooxygenase Coq7